MLEGDVQLRVRGGQEAQARSLQASSTPSQVAQAKSLQARSLTWLRLTWLGLTWLGEKPKPSHGCPKRRKNRYKAEQCAIRIGITTPSVPSVWQGNFLACRRSVWAQCFIFRMCHHEVRVIRSSRDRDVWSRLQVLRLQVPSVCTQAVKARH